jgi:hypothetical protein
LLPGLAIGKGSTSSVHSNKVGPYLTKKSLQLHQ